ncbi:MAG: hypothetical protein KAV82_01825 [Phycisphaerae bacterium]|nr:hypothetical protein [Phycisphaerae bacterium]
MRAVAGGFFLPIERTNDLSGFRMLRAAIEQTEFRETSSERKAPEGEESDRFSQADAEAREPTTYLGQQIDVTA